VQVACLANQAMNYLVSGKAPRRMGNGHPNIVPYQDFPTADGDMILAIGNDGQFARFCEIAGHAEWASDERFASNAARVKHRAELIPLLRQATVMKTTAEWIALLENAAVPCGPINDLAGVFADPQVVHRGLRVDLPHAPAARRRRWPTRSAFGDADRLPQCTAAAGAGYGARRRGYRPAQDRWRYLN
jgi:crotonobetainyl-CoA:carnitine CoA-transferase CaiB-like acyl-CoA transferase